MQWDTIQMQRGDMLLMVATSCHLGMPALPDAKDGLHGDSFQLVDPDAKHRHHRPNTTHLDPGPPPPRGPGRYRRFLAGTALAWTTCCGWGRGRLGGWGGGRGVLPRPSSPTPPRRSRPPPPHAYPYHPTFLSRSAPATDLAVMKIAPHSGLPFWGNMHRIKITKGDYGDAESEIPFAISGVAPPAAADHAMAPAQHRASVAAPQNARRQGMVNHLSK